jgi:hypothetical protein
VAEESLKSWNMKVQGSAVSKTDGRADTSSRASLMLASATSRPTHPAHDEEPHPQSLARLAELLAAHAPSGVLPLRVRLRSDARRHREMVRATVSPALCIVAQGAKVVVLGREIYSYDTSGMIAYCVDCR